MKETINNIEQNDVLKIVTMEVHDDVLAKMRMQKLTSFKTYDPEGRCESKS